MLGSGVISSPLWVGAGKKERKTVLFLKYPLGVKFNPSRLVKPCPLLLYHLPSCPDQDFREASNHCRVLGQPWGNGGRGSERVRCLQSTGMHVRAHARVCVCMSMPVCLCAMSAGDVGGWKGAWVPWSCGYKLLEEGVGNLVPLKEQPVL